MMKVINVNSDLKYYKNDSCYGIIKKLSKKDILNSFKNIIKFIFLYDVRIRIFTEEEILRRLYVKSDDLKSYKNKNILFNHRLQLFIN